METATIYRTLTISLPDDVYQRLRAQVEEDDMSRFIADLVRPHVVGEHALAAEYRETAATDEVETDWAWLEAEYAAQAADEEREREAREWLEADLGETLE